MPPVPQPGSGLLCRIRAGAGGFEESAQTRTCGRARTSAAENCAVAPRSSVLRNEDRRHLTETDEQGAARMLFVLALSLSPSLCATSSGVRGRTCHQHRAFAWPTLWIFATTLHSVLTSHARTAEKPVYQLHNSHNDRRSVAKPRTSKTLFMRAPRCTAPPDACRCASLRDCCCKASPRACGVATHREMQDSRARGRMLLSSNAHPEKLLIKLFVA